MTETLEEITSALADRYVVRTELGRGGMAVVYSARDTQTGRDVAIKVLNRDLTAALGPARFRREIEIASALEHPNILPVLGSGVAAGSLYYVMPLVDGESLHDRLFIERQLPVDEAVRLTREVAGALAYAHAHGIVHRDIKPENILLQDGHALVADFGIARATEAPERLTQTGLSIGTPVYMSPEQAAAERDLDGRSDQYSLGCVLYEMLAGTPPYSAPTAQGLMARHALEVIPSVSIVRNSVPEQVEDALYRALAKVPADRFPSMDAFAEALGDPAHWKTTGRRPPGQRATVVVPVVPAPRRLRVAAFVALGAVAVLGAGWVGSRYLARATASGTDAAVAARRVAVLYFEDLTADHRLTPVADGLTESLIAQLQRVDQLDVISPNGVAPYRDASVAVDSLQRALGVGTVVRGSVDAASGGRVQVSVSMLDARSGDRVATTSFVQPSSSVLALRDTLAQRVAVFLRERIGAEVQLRRTRAGTTSGEAWTLVQRAGRLRDQADSLFQAGDTTAFARTLGQADSVLVRADSLDPRWPEPTVVRGEIAARRAAAAVDPREVATWIDSGLVRATAALALDPRDAGALALRGALRWERWARRARGPALDTADSRQLLEGAEQDLRAAVAIEPTRAEAWNAISRLEYGKLNVPAANAAARRAYEADAYLTSAPAVLYRLFVTSYDMEQFVDAAHWCDLGRERFPTRAPFVQCQLALLSTRARTPDVDAAWRLVASYEQLVPKPSREYEGRLAQIFAAAVLARASTVQHRPELADSARHVLLRARASTDIDPRGELMGYEAFVRTMLGEREQAVDLLQRFLTAHPAHRSGFARANPWWWRDLQNDPRFRQLVAGSA